MSAVSMVVSAYVVAVIVSMDLGLDYTEREKSIYSHLSFQTLAVGSIIYFTLYQAELFKKNTISIITLVITGGWLANKLIGATTS